MIGFLLELTLRLFMFTSAFLLCTIVLSVKYDINIFSYILRIIVLLYEYDTPPVVCILTKSALQVTHFVVDFCQNLTTTVLTFGLQVLLIVFNVLFVISPYVVSIVLTSVTVFKELFYQLILGCGNNLNYVLSCVVWLSLIYLYIEYKYRCNIPQQQLRNINNRNVNENINFAELHGIGERLNRIPGNANQYGRLGENPHIREHRMMYLQYQHEIRWMKSEIKRLKEAQRSHNQFRAEDLTRFLDLIGQRTSGIEHDGTDSSSEQDEMSDREEVPREARNEDNNQSDLCSVCLEENRCIATFPCGHTHLCLSCVNRIMASNQKCPLCMDQIQDYRHIFL